MIALYLVFILTLGGVSVVLTILVLSLHHKPDAEEIPQWLIRLTNTCLLALACMKCCKKSKIDSDQDTLPVKIPPKPAFEEDDDCKTDLTWHKMSVIMDRVFFNAYIIIIFFSTGALFLILFT